ncbi:MAG: CAP domain-containing protein [Candidatus Heimdallarchaeota archaeon]|nr:CAP domain-containing protein [Candidatus Heimdallarchaeota archaeon]
MVLLIMVGLIGFQSISIAPIYGEAAVPTELEAQIHLLINEERSSAVPNFPVLKFQSTLIEIARTYSQYLYDNNHFDHIDLEGNGPSDRVVAKGIDYTLVAENLYMAENIPERQIANSAVDGWIKSDGHYRNMKSFTSFTGIGVYEQNGLYYITQIFVEASETHMKSVGLVYDNDNFSPLAEPTFFEKYQEGLILLGLILLIIFLGKRAESLNRQRGRR